MNQVEMKEIKVYLQSVDNLPEYMQEQGKQIIKEVAPKIKAMFPSLTDKEIVTELKQIIIETFKQISKA